MDWVQSPCGMPARGRVGAWRSIEACLGLGEVCSRFVVCARETTSDLEVLRTKYSAVFDILIDPVSDGGRAGGEGGGSCFPECAFALLEGAPQQSTWVL